MPIPANVDWTGQDVNFAGAPKWYAQVKEDLIRRLEALSHQIQHPYGLSPEALEGVRRQKAALEAQAQKLDTPYAIPLSITGTSEQVLFTPAELERARNDEVLARKIFESATGIPNPPRADVDEFRQRIIYQYPQLNEMVEKEQEFKFQQQEQHRRELENEKLRADDLAAFDQMPFADLNNNTNDLQQLAELQAQSLQPGAAYAGQPQQQPQVQQQAMEPFVPKGLGLSNTMSAAFARAVAESPGGEITPTLQNLMNRHLTKAQQSNLVTQINDYNAQQPQQQQQQQQVQQQVQQQTAAAPALSVDQIIANTGVKRSIAENIYKQVANKPGAVLGASDNLINTGAMSAAQVRNLENLFRQPNSAVPQPGAAYAGQPQQQPSLPDLDTSGMNSAQKARVSQYLNDLVKYQGNPNTYPLPDLDTSGMNSAQKLRVSNFQKSLQIDPNAAYAGQPNLNNQPQDKVDADINNNLLAFDSPAPAQQGRPEINPYANANNGYRLPVENLSAEQSILNRASIPLRKARLGEQHGRVAPMNPLHEQAQRMMQRNIDSDESAFEHAQSQLEDAQRLNLPREIRGHLQSGLTPTYELSDPYMNKYNRDVINALRQEAQTNFLEDIMPQVKGQYAATGAYHSGARQNELNRFAQKTQQQLNRDIAKLLHQGHEGAMNRAGEQNERQMQAAQIAGNATKAQQEAHLRNAEARRNLGLIQKESKKHDIAAVSQFASQHQQQLQNEMNAKQQAYLESQMEPHVRLGRYADTVAGIPSTSSMQVNAHRGPAPTPPNAYNVGAGLLGQVFGLQNQAAQFKKGGSVNNKYAPGGLVEKALQEYKQFADHVQPEKYDQEIQDLTTGFRNYKIDPIQNWVQHVSAQMLANNREDPLSNLGRGAIVAEENMMKHRDSMLASREKAANLYSAMNQSRQNQQHLLSAYAQKYGANVEQQRHNNAMEGLAKQKMQYTLAKNALGPSPKEKLDMEYKLAQIDALRGKNIPQTIDIGDVTISPKRKLELSSPELTQLKQIEKNRELNASKLHGYDEMVKFLQKQENEDNLPSTGIIAKYTPNVSDLSKEYERHLEKMVSGELPSGVLTNAKLAFAKGLKPTELDSPEKVKKFAEIGKEHYEELVRRDQIAEDLSAYNIPPRVSFAAYDQWKKNKFKGEIVDYVKAILEGGRLPLTQDDSNDASDISSLSDAELERIASQ